MVIWSKEDGMKMYYNVNFCVYNVIGKLVFLILVILYKDNFVIGWEVGNNGFFYFLVFDMVFFIIFVGCLV